MSIVPPQKREDEKEHVTLPAGSEICQDVGVETHQGQNIEGATDADPHKYPGLLELSFITMALCLSVFLVALDQTIVVTAIPKITDHFNSLDDVAWYGSAYLLTTCSFQLVFGRIFKVFSLKWGYISAIIIFEVGSAICGSAPNSTVLIIGRATAGLGSAGLASGALVILANSVPLQRRPAIGGMIGSMFGIANVCGPPLGGVLTDRLSWRWCFYVNLPIGAATAIFLVLFFKPPSREVETQTIFERLSEFDFVGLIFLFPGIVSILLGLQWGGHAFPWSNWRVILLFCVSGCLLVCFSITQIRSGEKGTIPRRIIAQRSVALGCIIALCIGAAFLTLVYFIPIYFQAIKGVTAIRSGVMILPIVISDVMFSIAAGVLIMLLGYYVPFMILGGAIFSIGAGLLHTLEVDTSPAKWICYQILIGAGNGMITQQPLIAIQAVLKPEDVSIGTSLIILFQTFGGAVFLSIGQAVFNNKLIRNLEHVMPSSFDPAVVLLSGATSLKKNVPLDLLPRVLIAYDDALDSTYILSISMGTAAFLASCGMEWVSVKGKSLLAGGA